jgi:hypothetical protein
MLGGDSLRAMQALARLSQSLSMELAALLIFRWPTPSSLASELERIQTEMEVDALATILEGLSPEERAKLLD